jgi:large subunit ribosomal protein L9
MKVILRKSVDNLGYKNDLVSVKDGYARNFLIPKGMAIYPTSGNLKMREETLKQSAHKEAKVAAEAEKMVEELKSMVIKVGAKVGENGKILVLKKNRLNKLELILLLLNYTETSNKQSLLK